MVIFQKNPYQNGKDFFGKITIDGWVQIWGGGGQNPREFGRGNVQFKKKIVKIKIAVYVSSWHWSEFSTLFPRDPTGTGKGLGLRKKENVSLLFIYNTCLCKQK